MPKKLIVCKFGGSSVANASQIRKVADIVQSCPSRRYIIVSAPGKKYAGDAKITNLLYRCVEKRNEHQDFSQEYEIIVGRFTEIVKELLPNNIALINYVKTFFENIKQDIHMGFEQDYIVSFGEYINALIIAHYLHYKFIDAESIIRFDEKGNLNKELTNLAISKTLQEHEYAVIPGFYGISADGKIKTFPRGGSDITGALVAKAMKANIYENWTDVDGLYAADPRVISEAKLIKNISYWEKRELGYSGAVVLAPDAILPVMEANIPIHIRNTNNPKHDGTMVVKEKKPNGNLITGIAGRKNFTIITLNKFGLHEEKGAIRRFAEIFEKNNVSIEHPLDTMDTITVVVKQESLENNDKLEKIKKQIYETFEVSEENLKLETKIALITVVGASMAYTTGIAGKIFTALGNADVNVRMINQGPSEINIIIGVANEDYKKAIRAIYDKFFKKWYHELFDALTTSHGLKYLYTD